MLVRDKDDIEVAKGIQNSLHPSASIQVSPTGVVNFAFVCVHSLPASNVAGVPPLTPTNQVKTKCQKSYLELLIAAILAQLVTTILKALPKKVTQIIYWVDLRTVLCWIQNNKHWIRY